MDLFQETTIGGLRARNHFVRSATGEGRATPEGAPTERIRQVYVDLAKGEVGTIITSLTSVADYEQASRNQLSITRDDLIPAYREITDAVHAEGGRIVMQLFHGSSTSQAYPNRARILGPSALRNPLSGLIPREITEADMTLAAKLFAEAAVRAKAAGFDGVQLHGAHSCLLSQFLSPTFNRRTDAYGGSRENRFRFVGEVYAAVRAAVGTEYPVWIKIDSTDGFPNGLKMEDFLYNGEPLSALGINAIEASGLSQPHQYRGAYYREAAELLAEHVDASVILTGGIRTLEDVQEIASESKVRYFGMARPFLAHPDYLLRMKKEGESL